MAIGVYKVRILYKNPKCRNYWGEFHRSLRKRRNNVEKLSGCFEIKFREIFFFWGLGCTYFMWEGLKFTPQTDGSKKFTLKNVYLQSGYLITRPWVWTLRGQGHFSFCKRTLQMENLEVYMRNFWCGTAANTKATEAMVWFDCVYAACKGVLEPEFLAALWRIYLHHGYLVGNAAKFGSGLGNYPQMAPKLIHSSFPCSIIIHL